MWFRESVCYSEADMKEGYFQEVYRIVRAVPPGLVTTYGSVAALAGRPGGTRTVGWAMRALQRGSDVPWHRVINAQGSISLPSPSAELQQALLENEGVEFDEKGQVDLARYGWDGRIKN